MSGLIEPPRMTASSGAEASSSAAADDERTAARKRLERKNKFRGDVVAYIVINLFLVGVWALTDRGYFWPAWVMGGWGVLLALDAWNAYFRRPISEADVDRELRDKR
jgi:hypothetical protein